MPKLPHHRIWIAKRIMEDALAAAAVPPGLDPDALEGLRKSTDAVVAQWHVAGQPVFDSSAQAKSAGGHWLHLGAGGALYAYHQAMTDHFGAGPTAIMADASLELIMPTPLLRGLQFVARHSADAWRAAGSPD